MSEDPSGFIAYTPMTTVAELVAAIDQALSGLGFRAAPRDRGHGVGFDLGYADGADGRLPCIGSVSERLPGRGGQMLAAWSFFPLNAADLQRLSTARYLAAIRATCIATEVVFGRAFHATLTDMVAPTELKGSIDMLTWVQYFGPAISADIGVERLASAAFHSLERLPNGAYLARTAESYGDPWPWELRRPLMDHLGLIPRKLYYKTGPTSQAEMRWC